MAQLPLQPMPSFDPDTAVGASLATRWKTWLNDFDTFLVASGITDKKQQRALLYIKLVHVSGRFSNNYLTLAMQTLSIQLK